MSATVCAPSLASFSRDLVHELGAVDQGDRAPLSGRPGGHRLPEALRRAGDDQDLAVEATGEDHLSQRSRLLDAGPHRRLRVVVVLGDDPPQGLEVAASRTRRRSRCGPG